MALFNFQTRFMPFIQDGTKRHTIRSIRRHPQKVGQLMHLYVGLRQTGAKRIIEPVICKDVKTIFITDIGNVLLHDGALMQAEANAVLSRWRKGYVTASLTELTARQKNALAWDDGFRPLSKHDAFDDMHTWFLNNHQTPFIGHIMCW